ncbi:hypothetical protein DPMN_107549, partial [Dreissena polymorpha]
MKLITGRTTMPTPWSPQGDMDNMTSYKQEYVEKHAPPAKAIRNDGQRMIPAKFEGEPTYR